MEDIYVRMGEGALSLKLQDTENDDTGEINDHGDSRQLAETMAQVLAPDDNDFEDE